MLNYHERLSHDMTIVMALGIRRSQTQCGFDNSVGHDGVKHEFRSTLLFNKNNFFGKKIEIHRFTIDFWASGSLIEGR